MEVAKNSAYKLQKAIGLIEHPTSKESSHRQAHFPLRLPAGSRKRTLCSGSFCTQNNVFALPLLHKTCLVNQGQSVLAAAHTGILLEQRRGGGRNRVDRTPSAQRNAHRPLRHLDRAVAQRHPRSGREAVDLVYVENRVSASQSVGVSHAVYHPRPGRSLTRCRRPQALRPPSFLLFLFGHIASASHPPSVPPADASISLRTTRTVTSNAAVSGSSVANEAAVVIVYVSLLVVRRVGCFTCTGSCARTCVCLCVVAVRQEGRFFFPLTRENEQNHFHTSRAWQQVRTRSRLSWH